METDDHCPLCDASAPEPIESIPYDRIWAALKSQYSAAFSRQVVRRHSVRTGATLSRCSGCGLHYFVPLAPGDADFYRELMQAVAYEPTRWEFGLVAHRLPPRAAVLDVGCGEGAFLIGIAGQAARAVGIDHNEAAVRRLRERGVEAYAVDVAAFAQREAEQFDAVCAFHLVEHLADVAPVIHGMRVCVRPGGRIFVSLPNRERCHRDHFEVLNSPPHHMSRWNSGQLRTLGERFRLELVELSYEEPHFSHISRRRVDQARRFVEPVAGPQIAKFLERAYRRVSLPQRYRWMAQRRAFTRRGIYGTTMLAEYRRAEA